MTLHPVDIGIIAVYFIAMIAIGVKVSRRASENLDSYFLCGKSLPWYILGLSNASAMFDITGTMWLVYILYVYGLKGIWLPWLWPTFNQIFLMIYLSVWIRRSNVLTGAAWISTRFGSGRGGEMSRIVIVVFALVSMIGFTSYAFQGIGKFSAEFFPWDFSPHAYAIVIMSLTAIYVIMGGMFSVVLTDVAQFVIMAISCFVIAYIAMTEISPDVLNQVIPAGWKDITFGWRLDLDWSAILPSVKDKIVADRLDLFGIFFMMMVFKGLLVSMAGPAPNYDMQRVLAARTPKEASLMSGLVSVALVPRWLMIAGITVIGLVFLNPRFKTMGSDIDFEMTLPYVINNFLPIGLVGLLMAGLLAAFMSTFSATVNAGAAYIVNDIYKRYINPQASRRRLMLWSYISPAVIVIVGILFGFMASSIDAVTQWIVSGLFGGYTAANVLKWYWYRLNGFGYFWGMLVGIAAALVMPMAFPNLHPLYGFPFILVFSTLASILGSLLTRPEDPEVLKSFYKQVRPWGFWKPVHGQVIREDPDFEKNKNFKRDMFNCLVGIAWQITLVTIPVYLVIKYYQGLIISILVLVVTMFILKKNWYDKLENV